MPALDHPASAMLDLDSARRLACGLVAPIGDSETLDLAQAAGRTSATSLRAEIALPRAARSAMDGFALRTADLAAALTLPVAGTVAAGMQAPPLPDGAALRIFTGAQIPAGADAVVPVEEVTETGAEVQLTAAPRAGVAYPRRGVGTAAGRAFAAPRHPDPGASHRPSGLERRGRGRGGAPSAAGDPLDRRRACTGRGPKRRHGTRCPM
ncbi:hypothetical protein ACTTAM_16110 [Rhodobacter capsulatus]|uniref:hypothetical protein n=1 Tax=Rhodobacter capsulatus TaxID=1061 RepID=UPI0040278C42